MQNNKRIIIMYDFDKTLSTNYMSEFKLIPDAGFKDAGEFWNYCDKQITHKYNMESNVAFLYATFEKAKENNIRLNKKYLRSAGESVKFYPGVEEWFKRINAYGRSKGLQVEHYIISSGIKDVILGTKIASDIDNVFASDFAFDSNGEAFWPSVIVNYTTKTQYIFRIRKNSTFSVHEDVTVNAKITDNTLVVPWTNMIYLGDGFTDIPSMEIIKNKGGSSICVYEKSHKDVADKIISDERVNYIAPTDYRDGEKIDRIVKNIIDGIANRVDR